jgi:fatty-acyl-CoA synthase
MRSMPDAGFAVLDQNDDAGRAFLRGVHEGFGRQVGNFTAEGFTTHLAEQADRDPCPVACDADMSTLHHPVRSLSDIEAIEREMPWAQRVQANSAYELIGQVARRLPDKPAIQYLPNGLPDDVPLTTSYGELFRRMTRTANLLHDFGIGPADTVSVLLPNLPQMHELLWGGGATGVVGPINPLLRPPQIAEIIQAAGARLLVTTGPGTECWDKARAALRLVKHPVETLRIGGTESAAALDFDRLLAEYPDDHLVSGREISRHEVAACFHTGGTTGDPKLAQHTHEGQLYQAWVAGTLRIEEDDVIPVGLPLFHAAAAYCWGIAPLGVGATLVLLGPMGFRNPAVVPSLWRLIERFRATRVGLVPTVVSALLNVPTDGIDLSTLKRFGCGAAPISAEVLRAFEAHAGVPVTEGYGLTEATALTHCTPQDGEPRGGSIGLRCPYVDVKVFRLDSGGRGPAECAPGEVGVLAVKGPTVMRGYRQERHNRGAFMGDGWLDTGDLGYVDSEGYFWVTGRAKDLIIRGGHNISPAWIEEALYQHPAVAFAAAVGKPDAYAGEVPVTYVVLKPGASAGAEELRAFSADKVPERPAAPSEVILVDQMPVTAVGKIFKPALRCDAARRALDTALAPLRSSGVEIRVEATPDEHYGIVAHVAILGADPGARQAMVADVEQILGGFTVHREVVIDF